MIDLTPPLIECRDIFVGADGRSSVPVWFEARAWDEIDPAPVVMYDHEAGSAFRRGVTTVRVTAFDAAGHAAASEFRVIVE